MVTLLQTARAECLDALRAAGFSPGPLDDNIQQNLAISNLCSSRLETVFTDEATQAKLILATRFVMQKRARRALLRLCVYPQDTEARKRGSLADTTLGISYLKMTDPVPTLEWENALALAETSWKGLLAQHARWKAGAADTASELPAAKPTALTHSAHRLAAQLQINMAH